MTATRYGPRPEIGELKPGQPVMVYRSRNDMQRRKPEDRAIPAEVVKAARVWVVMAGVVMAGTNGQFIRDWRMRRDTQDEGTQYSGSNASFATIEQYEWDETRRWARGFLRENGIEIQRGGAWDGREVALADLLASQQAPDTAEPEEPAGYDPGPTTLNPAGWPVAATEDKS